VSESAVSSAAIFGMTVGIFLMTHFG